MKNKKIKHLKGVSGGLSTSGLSLGGEGTNFSAIDNSSSSMSENIVTHDERDIKDKFFGFTFKA